DRGLGVARGHRRRALQVDEGQRSEERRVGKECRSRWSPDHQKKKNTRYASTAASTARPPSPPDASSFRSPPVIRSPHTHAHAAATLRLTPPATSNPHRPIITQAS